MEQLIVGSKDCSANVIVSELENHECAAQLLRHWRNLARRLDSPPVLVEALSLDMLLNKKSIGDVLSVLLENWSSQSSSEAKLMTFLDKLEQCQLKVFKDHLLNKLVVENLHLNVTQSQVRLEEIDNIRRFITPPQYLPQLFENDELSALVVKTDDIELTCTRFLETVRNGIIFKFNDFLKHISTPLLPTTTNEHINVVICENNLDKVLLLLTKSMEKCVLITTQSAPTSKNSKIKVVNDTFGWTDLTPIFKNQIQTKCEKLMEFAIDEPLEVFPKLDHEVLLDINREKFPNILRENIPEDMSYYIPRRLRTRYILDDSIFQYEGSDIFFIEGIDRLKLSELLNGKPTNTSSNALFQSFDYTTKFVVLEKLSHFELIVNKHKYTSIDMHLLAYEDDQILWKKSKGGIKTIQRFVSVNQCSLKEENVFNDFIKNYNSGGTICVSDAPGMGKSILLAHFARKLKSVNGRHPLGICFVAISELAEKFIATKAQGNPNERILSAMASCLCKNDLGVAYFRYYQHEIKDIVLDGLDELNPKVCDGYELIRLVQSKFSKSRIWVATRPHLLFELERALSIIGYNIEPFDIDDQVKFLKKYWRRNAYQIFDSEKLTYFAKTCLLRLKATISNENDCDVAGIPLQCLLIGDVFEDELKIFISSGSYVLPTVSINSMTDLYDRLVKKKYETFFQRYESKGLNESILTSAHIKLSISLLFPKYHAQEKAFKYPGFSMEDIINVGIVLTSSGSSAPRFIHRTFAEYFLARYIVDNVLKNYSESNLDFITQQVLETLPKSIKTHKGEIKTRSFKNNVICYFVDALLKNTDHKTLWNINSDTSTPIIPTNKLRDIVEASIHGGFESILRFIVCKFESFHEQESNVFNMKLLFLCTLSSNKSLCAYVFKKFRQVQQKGIIFSNILRNDQTLLHYAVVRGNYEIFDFVLGQQKFHDKLKAGDKSLSDIIHVCVQDTCLLPNVKVNTKCDIVKRLHKLNPGLLFKPEEKSLPIFCSNIHLNLLKMLIEYDHEKYKIDSLVQVLHNATFSLNSTDYMQLLDYFKNTYSRETNTKILNETFQGNRLIERILLKLNPIENNMLDYLKQFGVNFDSKNTNKHLLLHLAIEKNINLPALKWLLHNPELSRKQMENAFWHAHDCQNIEFIKLVVQQKRIPPNLQDNLGFTSLRRMCGASSHTTRSLPITFKQLEYIRLLITHGAKVNARNILFYRTKRPVEYLVDTMPSVIGFQVLDLLQIEIPPIERAFLKWEWLLKSETIDELNFKDCADVCVKDVGNVDAQDKNGNTLLHFAAKFHNATALKNLLTQNVNVNIANKNGETPLDVAVSNLNKDQTKISNGNLKKIIVYACENCQSKAINFFCAWYALVLRQPLSEINLDSEGNRSLLEFAISRHDGEILEYFAQNESCIQELASFDSSWIQEFVKNENPDFASVKFVRMATRIHLELLSTKNDEGLVPLSTKGIRWDWVKPLVRLGANVNASDPRGNTPLHWALKHNSYNQEYLVRELLKCGADINSQNEDDESPISLAAKTGKGECVKLLLGHNDFKLDQHKLKTVFISIVFNCDLKTIKFVCEWYKRETGNPVSTISGEFHSSILDIALLRWEASVLEYFLVELPPTERENPKRFKIFYDKLKMKPRDNEVKCAVLMKSLFPEFWNSPNESGLVPLSIKGIHDEWVKHLVDLGADVNLADGEGNTPLHWQLKHDHWNVSYLIRQLVKCGADVNSKTRAGETPLTLALNLSNPIDVYLCVKELLKGNADVRRRDSRCNTFLHLLPPKLKDDDIWGSKASQFHEILEIVLKKGCGDVLDVRGSEGLTPIQIAQKHFRFEKKTFELLAKHRVPI